MNSLAIQIRNNPNFKWQSGMRSIKVGPSGASGRVVDHSDTPRFRGLLVTRGDRDDFEHKKSVLVNNTSCVPDLKDLATAGILFQNLSSRCGTIKVTPPGVNQENWCVQVFDSFFYGNFFGEACANALLHCWQFSETN